MNCTCTCCKNCSRRTATCHLTCAEYLTFKAEREAFNQERYRQKEAEAVPIYLAKARHNQYRKTMKYKNLN